MEGLKLKLRLLEQESKNGQQNSQKRETSQFGGRVALVGVAQLTVDVAHRLRIAAGLIRDPAHGFGEDLATDCRRVHAASGDVFLAFLVWKK